MVKKGTSSRRKKEKKNIIDGLVHIHATFNNTIINITDMNGNTIAWASTGESGFKGNKKGTPFAAQLAAEKVVEDAKYHGLQNVNIRVKGPGPGREAVIRSIAAAGINVKSIRDVTPIPHNGCRPKKKRRI